MFSPRELASKIKKKKLFSLESCKFTQFQMSSKTVNDLDNQWPNVTRIKETECLHKGPPRDICAPQLFLWSCYKRQRAVPNPHSSTLHYCSEFVFFLCTSLGGAHFFVLCWNALIVIWDWLRLLVLLKATFWCVFQLQVLSPPFSWLSFCCCCCIVCFCY